MHSERSWLKSLIIIILMSLTLVPLAGSAAPPTTIYVVTNTSDYGSSDPVVTGSLRWAMT